MADNNDSGCGIFLFIVMAASWLTHVVYCLQNDKWGLLIGGAIFFPVGMIHGVMIWFGWA